MNDARNRIEPADREGLAKRVAELEQRTDAEVVCAVATESGRYDRAVREKISEADLDAIRVAVLAEVRQGRVVGGLMAGLDQAEPILAKVFPHTDTAKEGLSNEVLLFHPRP